MLIVLKVVCLEVGSLAGIPAASLVIIRRLSLTLHGHSTSSVGKVYDLFFKENLRQYNCRLDHRDQQLCSRSFLHLIAYLVLL